MNRTGILEFLKNRLATVLGLILLIAAITSCSKKVAFSTSSVQPAAEGYVKIKPNHGNYAIDVSLYNLAPSDKLSPSREMYVVWAETKDDGVKNIGSMNSSTGLLSKRLKASLNATLAFKPRKIFVTAENETTPSSPHRETVISTKKFKIR